MLVMFKFIWVAALCSGCLVVATSAFAQQNQNPMGLDYGAFHPAVPPQVTTYYPPAQPTVGHRRHRFHRPMS